MAWHKRLLNQARSERLSREIEREMEFHLAERVDELVAEGMSREEAEREARRRFGNEGRLRERTRDVDMLPWLESLIGDVRYGARALRASPAFTLVAVLSLGLGIGANTAIFSLIDAVLLRSLPVRDPQELVQVTMGESDHLTNPLWEEIRDRQDAFSGAFAVAHREFDLAAGGESRRVAGYWVSGDFFATLGVRPAAGRLLAGGDDARGCAPVAVIGHGFWRSEYGGRADAVGRTVTLDGHPFQIVGVAEPSFTGVDVGRAVQVYAPLCAEALVEGEASVLDGRSNWFLRVLARPLPGSAMEEAGARLAALSPGIFAATLPANWDARGQREYLRGTLKLRPAGTGLSAVRSSYGKALLVLMAVVALVLLIACANVANLLLARATTRRREIAVRIAIGAGRGRVVRQLITESLLLSLVGGAVGVLFARWSSGALVRFLSTREDPVWLDLPLDLPLLGFTIAVSVATGVLFGLAPAWRSSRMDPQGALRAGGRGVSAGRSALALGRALVVGQVAISLVLVVAAGLLLGSFRTLGTLDPGFRREGVLLVEMDLQNARFPAEQRPEVHRLVLERLRDLPGVRSASASFITPLSGSGWNGAVKTEYFAPAEFFDGVAWLNAVSDDYFATLGTEIRAGRDFGPGDRKGSARVAVINESMARKFFAGVDPVGATFLLDSGPEGFGGPIEVVGVVEDAKYGSLREEESATAYLSFRQAEALGSTIRFALRTDRETASLVPLVESIVRDADPRASLVFRTLAEEVSGSLRVERLLATLSGFFGALALLLACIGLYGTLAYGVARRRTEIGIRIALGAARKRVVGMVLGEVGRVLAVGILLGGAAALAAARLVSSFLFGLSPWDPRVLALAVLALTLGGVGAAAWPAWRAARTDPRVALQEE